MIEGFEIYKINNYIKIDDKDLNDFDKIIHSEDSLIIIKKYKTLNELKDNWKEQMYFVGGYIQNKFDMLNLPESCLWNTYIIYLVNFDVSTQLKIEIETDKFCCKKYVIDTRNKVSESEAIIEELPALTSLCIRSNICEVINDETTIKKLFVSTGEINEKIKDYFINKEEYNIKSIDIVIDEMVGILDELD
ncbi:ABC-three component system middle component 1 [Candidatus Clostridium radicumherbarum]|uniref:ABC-three component system middle component 1 n=1 Tax=Candidatus Clostridium radicumherbarum TaxID=3381662 RepID=A0ABW8TN15_9CLOT